jgi:hypothetical protein
MHVTHWLVGVISSGGSSELVGLASSKAKLEEVLALLPFLPTRTPSDVEGCGSCSKLPTSREADITGGHHGPNLIVGVRLLAASYS